MPISFVKERGIKEMEHGVQQHTGEKLMRIVMFTLALSAMSVLMFNFVLPQLSEEFGLTNAQVSWVTSSYALIYGIGTIIYGKLADRYKLKDLLTFGLLFFAVGSLIGLTSQTFWMVLAGRCIQALGAASIPATAMLIPIRYFPLERRGSAMGMAFVGLAIGSALGPVISALILSVFHWRWLFCIPFIILITLPFYRKYLDDGHGDHRKLDWIGGGLLATAVTLLLLSVTVGEWLFAIGGVLSVVLFLIRICSTSDPFIQPYLFTIKSYTLVLTITFLISGIGFSLYYLSPLLLADIHQLPPSWIGFALVPGAAASAILGRSGGRLADLKGNSYLFFIASILLVSCFVLLSTFTGVSPVFIAIFLIVGNVGQTFMMITMSNSVSMTLSKEQAGVGMGLFAMLNFIAGGIATGVYGKMVDLGAVRHWNPVHYYSNGAIYSNIFLILATLHLAVLLLYIIQFNRGVFSRSKIVGEKQKTKEKWY